MTERELEILKTIKEQPLISQNELADLLGITRSGVAAHIHKLTKKGYIKGKAYVLSEPSFVTVVGGINIDIFGTAKEKIIRNNSNPGTIMHLLGGAGRNIALTLTKLEVPNYFISVYGDDSNGKKFVEDAKENGMEIQYCEMIKGEATSSFLCINDSNGRRITGIDDMDIYRQMTPGLIERNIERMNNAKYCILDTNLPNETFSYICDHVTSPIVVKTVSLNKNESLIRKLSKIDVLVTTEDEISYMLWRMQESFTSLDQAMDRLLEKGVHNVIVFSPKEGLHFKNKEHKYHMQAPLPELVNTNGASATLTGALVWCLLNNMKWKDAIKYSYAAAVYSMESEEAVNPGLSQDSLLQKKTSLFE